VAIPLWESCLRQKGLSDFSRHLSGLPIILFFSYASAGQKLEPGTRTKPQAFWAAGYLPLLPRQQVSIFSFTPVMFSILKSLSRSVTEVLLFYPYALTVFFWYDSREGSCSEGRNLLFIKFSYMLSRFSPQ